MIEIAIASEPEKYLRIRKYPAYSGSAQSSSQPMKLKSRQNSSFPFSAQSIESEHTIVGRYFHKSNLLSENGKDL